MERLKKLAEQLQDYGFQSLVGFKINWNDRPDQDRPPTLGRFQSLVGFKINWNPESHTYQGFRLNFQSLIGFKINWNGGRLQATWPDCSR